MEESRPQSDLEFWLRLRKKDNQPVVLLDHWHLRVDDHPVDCGSFTHVSQVAINILWKHLGPVERACEAYRNHLRCDVCHPCRVYDRLDSVVHWLRVLRDEYFTNRVSFELRRTDLNFDDLLPSGVRLRVSLRDPKLPCFSHDELDFQ